MDNYKKKLFNVFSSILSCRHFTFVVALTCICEPQLIHLFANAYLPRTCLGEQKSNQGLVASPAFIAPDALTCCSPNTRCYPDRSKCWSKPSNLLDPGHPRAVPQTQGVTLIAKVCFAQVAAASHAIS